MPRDSKDTYVSLALTRGVNISWLVGQTGVSYPTMLRHYGTFLRSEGPDQLEKLSDQRGDSGRAAATHS